MAKTKIGQGRNARVESTRPNGRYKRCGGFGGCGGSGFVGSLPHARCSGTGMRPA